jgi:Zn-dependent M28 family amino/carboxypeptidase
MIPALGHIFKTAEPRLAKLTARRAAIAESMYDHADEARIRSDVEHMAKPRNRFDAPGEAQMVQQYIFDEFRAAGWHTELSEFTFRNVAGFSRPDEDADKETIYEEVRGVNVVARKRGRAHGKSTAIVIGAHYDTVPGSPGADDNASGVAALLELGRLLGQVETRSDIVLVALDAEEIGIFGARALAADLNKETWPSFALIFESIGFFVDSPATQTLPPYIGYLYPGQVARMRRRRFAGDWALVMFRRDSAAAARSFGEVLAHITSTATVMTARDPADLPVIGRMVSRVAPFAKDFMRSDHVELWKAGIPAVMITDTANFRNPNYHCSSDTPDTLDYGRIRAIAAASAALCVYDM